MTVERRPVKVEELADFAEVAACGTAVVITPVGRIFDGDTVYDYNITEIGPNMRKLYEAMTGIQYGELPDTHNWTVEI
jgi:branched-chain amino acid aminotransferase